VPLEFFPSALCVKPFDKDSEVDPLGWQILAGLPFDNASTVSLNDEQLDAIGVHSDNLVSYCISSRFYSLRYDQLLIKATSLLHFTHPQNSSQAAALRNAFYHRFSVIKGPPGTGKTRTIASIADVAQSGNMRVLIIAPGNSASRRILESIVKTGFEEACLVVAQEFFYEWHEEAYGELSTYVHTKSTTPKAHNGHAQHGRSGSGAGGGNTAVDRSARDFRKRVAVSHVGKWSDAAALEEAAESSNNKTGRPAVVIGTYGSIALSGLNEGAAAKKLGAQSWAKQVQRLVDSDSIDILIIDETSQLWSGYGLSLLGRLSGVKNVVLVGDEKQLAPHGVPQVLVIIFTAFLFFVVVLFDVVINL
jgi:hypothetical protein